MLRVALATCALCAVAMLLLAPSEVAAKSSGVGFGARAFHSGHHGAFRRAPFLGGVITSTPYAYYGPDYVGGALLREVVSPPPEPPRVLNCHRSQETVIVPSEDSGTREIRITRC
jgi:hypothetical protein